MAEEIRNETGAELIARLCHEANRVYCQIYGDDSQVLWKDAPIWQRDSCLNGVQAILDGTITSPSQSHETWLEEKKATGWRYGPVKSSETKEHPCFVSFDDLPEMQKQKDRLFFAIVTSFKHS